MSLNDESKKKYNNIYIRLFATTTAVTTREGKFPPPQGGRRIH